MKNSKTAGIAVAMTLVVGSVAALAQKTQATSLKSAAETKVLDAKGNLHVPESYRSLYQALGTWAIAADSGPGSKQMHEVFASPGTTDAYRKTGHFPDGTVLVKEVWSTSTNPMTTGIVSHAAKLKGWFVMVRDKKNSHPGNLLWGEGWDWSWFDADNPLKTTSTSFKSDCKGCHIPARTTEWVYVNGYPALRR